MGKEKQTSSKAHPICAFMLATQLDPQHFKRMTTNLDATTDGDGNYSSATDFMDWSDDELKTIDNIQSFTDTILKRVMAIPGVEVKSCYGICHDKDECEVWDESAHKYVKEPIEKHDHVYLDFTSRNKGALLSDIATAVGLPTNMIEKPKPGRYSTDNMQAYLIHAKNAEKHFYDPSEVYTACGKDYIELYVHRRKDWDKGRAAKNRQRDKRDVDWLIDKARFGEIGLDEIITTPEYYEIYSLPGNKKKVEDALEAWSEKRMHDATMALDHNDYSTKTIYVYGRAGQGKTTLVKAITAFCNKKWGWDCARLAGSNALDDYKGQDIVWLDDVSSRALPTVDDWLKLLDPHNANAQSARYKNKAPIAPHLIIITSNQKPLNFFYFMKGIGGGDRTDKIDAFYRRIGLLLVSTSADEAIVKDYNFYGGPLFRAYTSVNVDGGVVDYVYSPQYGGSQPLYHHFTFAPMSYNATRKKYLSVEGTDWMKDANGNEFTVIGPGSKRYYQNAHQTSPEEILSPYDTEMLVADVLADSMNTELNYPDDYIFAQNCVHEAYSAPIDNGTFPKLPSPDVIHHGAYERDLGCSDEATYEIPTSEPVLLFSCSDDDTRES